LQKHKNLIKYIVKNSIKIKMNDILFAANDKRPKPTTTELTKAFYDDYYKKHGIKNPNLASNTKFHKNSIQRKQ